MPQEVIIALSIEETNQLRQQLGLAPLRTDNYHHAVAASKNGNDPNYVVSNVTYANRSDVKTEPQMNGDNTKKEFLELSVSETNKLRQELGLPPLKLNSSATESRHIPEEEPSSNTTNIHHVPAINEGERHDVAERIERAKLKRLVEDNIKTQFAAPALGVPNEDDNDNDGPDDKTSHRPNNNTKSWAQRMRTTTASEDRIAKPTNNQTKSSLPKRNQDSASNKASYQEQDLHGLHVGHSISELEDGSTTILTLKDAPLLQTAEEDTITSKKIIGLNDTTDVELQNIQLVQQQQVEHGLREKRKMELGFGRTGGYVGYDDDEFEELGGTQAPSRLARSTMVGINAAPLAVPSMGATTKKQKKGFQIGTMLEEQDADMESDIVTAILKGKAISLAESITNVDVRPSDYMTPEEYKAMDEEQKLLRKSKKNKKSHKAKDKKKHKRRTSNYDSDEGENNVVLDSRSNERSNTKDNNSANLLEELDATAVDGPNRNAIRKKRNRDGDDDTAIDAETNTTGIDHPMDMDIGSTVITTNAATNKESLSTKRERYEQVMTKGNVRSQKVFATTTAKTPVDDAIDEEPDDAFLNAALEKARRWNRLKSLQTLHNKNNPAKISSTTKGAEAVVAALQQANNSSNAAGATGNDSNAVVSEGRNNTIVFKIDETHEFTRTLMARTEQMDREQARLNNKRNNVVIKLEPKIDEGVGKTTDTAADDSNVAMNVKEESVDMDVDLHELAKEVKIEDTSQPQYHIGLDGTTVAAPKIGRGVGGLLQLLQQSGELQNRTNDKKKEEMRGRAKDKRTYEDYEPLDLSKVVRIDERNATDKDKEFASREVKLEYRDEHGRLLTRKEAFRDLSYQFHGYGSGKRKQEKKLQQIAREQAEARIVSQQLNEGTVHTTFGALKETQRATGKAFVIHKTGA